MMRTATILTLLALAPPVAAQDRVPCAVAQKDAVVIYGEIPAPIVLTRADLATLPQASASATPHGGEAQVYAGPTLESVLAPANLPRGPQLRGSALTTYIVVEAADGYRAVFALAELDAAFRSTVPLLALAANGSALGDDAGPFQVIVPDEQRHARWVRQVTCIRIARAH